MSVETFVQAIVSFVKDHEAWAPVIAFGVAFLESFCFLSIAWPGWIILVSIAGLLGGSGASIDVLMPSIIGAGLGGTLGYAISYWIGVYYKDTINGAWPFRNYPDMIPRGETFFQNWGTLGVFFGHFFGPVRAVIPVIAGMYRMPQLPFQIANVASAFIWAAFAIAPSYFGLQYIKQWMGW